ASKNISSEGIVTNAVPTLATNPKRLQNVAIDITLPEGFPPDKKDAIIKVAHACPVHHTLMNPPEIDIDIV
ncbi:MAG: hypothetical protein HQM16_07565, partial [Deltaproteobacteria bacterium]|nr:hypothetical protein [Deltaproteobacteria bacterium]